MLNVGRMPSPEDRPYVEAFREFLRQAHSGEIDPRQMQADDEVNAWWDAEVERQRQLAATTKEE